MLGRVAARLLALFALAAVAVGVYLIVHSTVIKHDASTTTQSQTIRRGGHPRRRHAKPKPMFYTVKQGDTLSSISAKTGVSLGRLTALNPSVSTPPYNLQTGQRLRLRR